MKIKKIEADLVGKLYFIEDNKNYIYNSIVKTAYWEKNEVDWIKKNLSKDMVCINVGANIGYHSILMSQILNGTGSVYCFEPHPQIFQILEKNIKNNNLTNIKAFNCAVSNISDDLILYENEGNNGDGRIFNPKIVNELDYMDHGFSDNIKEIKVPCTTIDLFMKKNNKLDILVIDAQGADMLVLDGAENTIKKFYPKILFEFTPEWNNKLKIPYADIFEKLFIIGYRAYILKNNMIDITDNLETEIKKIDFYENIVLEKK